VRDHGGQLELDFSTDDLESKVESIIRELRNVLKETTAEGGERKIIFLLQKIICLINRNGNVS
jgi:hypothetical protein